MRPEQPPTFDADLNNVADIVQDDLYGGAFGSSRVTARKR